MPSVCKSCGCSDIDTDPARGDAVCTKCGSVVDDHIIVSEVEFEENSAGGANVIGQFVSAEGSNSISLGQNFKQSLGRDSRQQIYNNGRQMVNNLGSQLSLSRHCLETAFMFYKLAVNRRLTQGRRTIHVVGACLYLVCRTEKTPHLLIDISDVTQTDVFTLGRTFLAISRELCIDVPTTDPSLYIHRFAHQLKFGDKENEVSTTALRLVSRMKRDWMSTGRRPSGLCGAALIVASRLHGFSRSVKDVVKVVRLSHSTILQRLVDFGKTASSKLTVDEFNKIDLEEEADPPSFTRARQRAKQAQMFDENIKYSSPDLLAQLASTQERVEMVLEKRKMIEDDIANRETVLPSLEERRKMLKARLPVHTLNFAESKSSSSQGCSKDEPDQSTGFVVDCETSSRGNEDESGCNFDKSSTLTKQEAREKELIDTITLFNKAQKEAEDAEESDVEDGTVQKKEEDEQDNELDLEGLDDTELDDCLLGEDEVEVKTKVWMEENGDFMIKLQEKEEREAAEMEKKLKNGIVKKKKPRRKKNASAADTADEAIKTMLAERKLSTKINYDVLRDLAAEGGVDINGPVKMETKVDTKEDQKDLFKVPIVYESGPVEKKLKFRSGLKRPTQLQTVSKSPKKVKVESSLTETASFIVKKETKITSYPATPVSSTSTSTVMKCEVETPKEYDLASAVFENGPVHNEVDGEDIEDDEEEAEDQPMSASQLLGLSDINGAYGEHDDYGEEFY